MKHSPRPWRHSSNAQRLDPENGPMLTPDVDHLFDRGFITFTACGKLHFAPSEHRDSLIPHGHRSGPDLGRGGFSPRQRESLEFHGDLVFLGAREG